MGIVVSYVQAGGYAAADDRRLIGALFGKGVSATTARSGILPFDGSEAAVTAQPTPNMTVAVAPFAAVLADAAGGYLFTLDAAANVSIAPADGTNPRLDLVVARVYDNEAGDSAPTQSLTLPGSAGTTTVQQYTGALEVLQGTPSVTPAAPTGDVTSRMLVLKTVRVEAGATSIVGSKLTDANRAGFAVAAGGILPVKDTSEASTLSGYRGRYVDTGADGVLRRHNGTGWELARAGMPAAANLSAWYGSYSGQPLRLLGGHGTFTTNSGSYTSIAFGETVAGVKSVMVNGAVDGYDVTVHATAAYPTGFDMQVWNGSALLGPTNIVLDWMALVW